MLVVECTPALTWSMWTSRSFNNYVTRAEGTMLSEA